MNNFQNQLLSKKAEGSLKKYYLKIIFDLPKKCPGRAERKKQKQSNQVKAAGEQIALDYLRRILPYHIQKSLHRVASKEETPGWNCEYKDNSEVIAITIKASESPEISIIELSTNEWDAARILKKNYNIFLVFQALTENPRIEIINDPYTKINSGKITLIPSDFRRMSL
ncbi:MAG: DUF3883 domain-containing protein [Candidatus Kuenenia sp.]|nr:DUF3883 domain-containing protein [Candidatus Kuenenia hertensis]